MRPVEKELGFLEAATPNMGVGTQRRRGGGGAGGGRRMGKVAGLAGGGEEVGWQWEGRTLTKSKPPLKEVMGPCLRRSQRISEAKRTVCAPKSAQQS